jgi:hypothetical protein
MVTDPKPMQYQSVGGWLLLLCFALVIGSPLRTLYNMISSYQEAAALFSLFPGLYNLFFIDSFLGILLMILSIRAGVALWSLKPSAVKTTKNYLLFLLGYSFLALFLPFTAGLPAEANKLMIPELAKGLLQSLVFIGIWYWYLNDSKRVKQTYIQ